MSDEEDVKETEDTPKKSSLVKTLILSGVSALVLGGVAAGVAFIAPGKSANCEATLSASDGENSKSKNYEDVAFVNLEPLVVSLGPNAHSEYLKISITLETTTTHTKSIEHLRPKFRDVLNTYLRAVDERDLTEPAAMTRLRAQMLRRAQLVAPSDAIANILITDFVLN